MRKERIQYWIASHLPDWLIYWCVIIVWADASSTKKYSNYTASTIPVCGALGTWQENRRRKNEST